MEDLYKLKKGILWDVQANIAYNIKICDNACGSGAFLLAAANILWNIHKNLKDLVKTKGDVLVGKRWKTSEVELWKRMVSKEIFNLISWL